MSERKLAHIEKVVDLQPIPNADKLEVATVLGWQCVVKKGEVKVGELVCYLEIDSIVPDIPFFEFMRERKFRVKTIKLRGQVSQGLVIPMGDFQVLAAKGSGVCKYFDEGEDVTELIGVTKWLSPSERESDYVPLSKKKHNWFTKFMTRFSWYRKLTKQRSKSFPEWISKTDEERIQNMPWICQKYSNEVFYTSEKLEGQSATYWFIKKRFGSEFGICSRTVRKFEMDNSNWSRVAKEYDIKNKLKSVGKNIAIQGEVIGGSIQGNIYKLPGLDFYIFNVYDIDKKEYYLLDDLIAFCKKYGFKNVPILQRDYKLPATIQEILEHSKGKSVLADVDREGIVIRTFDKKISFKAVNPDYLLKQEN